MKAVYSIWRADLRRLTASVVAIVTLLGLCIIPCLYAWFNIFSNWAPYDSEATGRIQVAVVNRDAGATILGVELNLGDKIVSALEGNDAMGWVFLDEEDAALEGVRAGDYYAALIVPASFTGDAVSFASGEAKNPEMRYYENEKKNAIAPKITGKAKTAVQEQINATIIETAATVLGGAVSAAESGGLDAGEALQSLSDRMQTLSARLETAQTAVQAAQNLSRAADALLRVSETLLSDAGTLAAAGERAAAAGSDALDLNAQAADLTAGAARLVRGLDQNLALLQGDVETAFGDLEHYNAFVADDLSGRVALARTMAGSAERACDAYDALGLSLLSRLYSRQAERYARIADRLAALETADEAAWSVSAQVRDDILREIADARAELAAQAETAGSAVEGVLSEAMGEVQSVAAAVGAALSRMEGAFRSLGSALDGSAAALSRLNDGLSGTAETLSQLQTAVSALSGALRRVLESDVLDRLGETLGSDTQALAAYLASPVSMETVDLYPIREYGSAMASFYTVLAQWIGSLFAAVLLKVRVRRAPEAPPLRQGEAFWGRYGLFFSVGLIQALIVSLGDLFYVDIQCLHPAQFVLAACVNGVSFSMILFAMVYALENIGQALAVVVLVVQVAGAGGTYPVEVLPQVFQRLYPFMPFRFAMDAMRECVGGMYGLVYWRCLGALLLYAVGFAALGQLLYYPARGLNRLIDESKRRSDIMV